MRQNTELDQFHATAAKLRAPGHFGDFLGRDGRDSLLVRATQRACCMTLETISSIGDNPTVSLPAVSA